MAGSSRKPVPYENDKERFPVKYVVLLTFVMGIFGCASGNYRANVKALDLRDPRLPLEARKWLADAEDEVAIARANMDDAQEKLSKLRSYCESLDDRIKEQWLSRNNKNRAQAVTASKAFNEYSGQRIELSKLELEASEEAYGLAMTRLDKARAETAMRYDLAVYPVEEIVEEVERKRGVLAKLGKQIDEQIVRVEKAADQVWSTFTAYVSTGGVTNVLWQPE